MPSIRLTFIWSFFPLALLLIITLHILGSSSILGTWCGLEIMILIIMWVFNFSKEYLNSEAGLKYCIIQMLGSGSLLAGLWTLWPSFILITLGLSLKLGLFPFYFWVTQVYKGRRLVAVFLISTITKLPLLSALVSSTLKDATLGLIVLRTLSIGVLSFMGVGVSLFFKALSFSSVIHTRWACILRILNGNWPLYIFLYSTILGIALYASIHSSITYVHDCPPSASLHFVSLGGVPPMVGFSLKWLAFPVILKALRASLSLLLIVTTIFRVVWYLWWGISLFLLSQSILSNSWSVILLLNISVLLVWLSRYRGLAARYRRSEY